MKPIRFFTGVLLVLLAHNMSAQIPMPQSPFVKLRTGKVITGSHVEMKDRFFAASTVTIDSLTVKSREVDFYGDEYGHLFGRIGGSLSEAVYSNSDRDIYFFKSVTTTYTPGNYGAGYGGMRTGGYYSTRVTYGYTLGLSGLQAITLDNVSRDMSRDSVALGFILRAKTQRTRARISLAIIGVGLLMTYSSLLNTNNRSTPQLVLGGTLLTIGGSISAAVFSGKKRKDTRRAVTAYSGFVF